MSTDSTSDREFYAAYIRANSGHYPFDLAAEDLEPEDLEPEWDGADSAAFQARVDAGEIDQHGQPRQPGTDEWGDPAAETEAEAT